MLFGGYCIKMIVYPCCDEHRPTVRFQLIHFPVRETICNSFQGICHQSLSFFINPEGDLVLFVCNATCCGICSFRFCLFAWLFLVEHLQVKIHLIRFTRELCCSVPVDNSCIDHHRGRQISTLWLSALSVPVSWKRIQLSSFYPLLSGLV